MIADIQVIKKNNLPEFVVIPYKIYKKIAEQIEDLKDIEDYKKIKVNDKEEIPAEFVFRICEGENPIRVYREYKRMTQEQLAKKINKTKQYISNLEKGKIKGSINSLKEIAEALKVSIGDLV